MTHDLGRVVVRSSWYAIGLGLLFEVLQLGALRAAGAELPALAAILADTTQKVSWSYIVCVALACGTAATRAGPGAMSVVGFMAAPLSFAAARAIHKSASQVLAVSVPAGGPSPWLLAGIKGVEYALLGWLITRLIRRPEPRLSVYARTGLIIGVLFGALLLWIMNRAAADGLPAPVLVARGLNELLFPVGCSCLLWITGVLARRVA